MSEGPTAAGAGLDRSTTAGDSVGDSVGGDSVAGLRDAAGSGVDWERLAASAATWVEYLSRWTPPTIPVPEGGRLSAFDDLVDAWFERHLRGVVAVDRLMYAASAVGDHGIVWLFLAGVQAGRLPRAWRRPLLRAAAGLGMESALVNGPVKLMFRRSRPVHLGARPLHLRLPRTSSFPSGHATAAFFGAALLSEGDPWAPLYYAIAMVVAASRLHVRIHHASDVVGGMILGAALGVLARRLVPLEPPAPLEPPGVPPSRRPWAESWRRPRR